MITKITGKENGPLIVEFNNSDTKEIGLEFWSKALCRCGASANKPFCDGAHKACKFVAAAFGELEEKN